MIYCVTTRNYNGLVYFNKTAIILSSYDNKPHWSVIIQDSAMIYHSTTRNLNNLFSCKTKLSMICHLKQETIIIYQTTLRNGNDLLWYTKKLQWSTILQKDNATVCHFTPRKHNDLTHYNKKVQYLSFYNKKLQ